MATHLGSTEIEDWLENEQTTAATWQLADKLENGQQRSAASLAEGVSDKTRHNHTPPKAVPTPSRDALPDKAFQLYLDRRRRAKFGLADTELPVPTTNRTPRLVMYACKITGRAELEQPSSVPNIPHDPQPLQPLADKGASDEPKNV
ncbi:hypothetical protein [Vreelandella venusta]|uniref:hypothetical protein n=1 Tax=Vreelandella venusta TaxID=44935 RepID=UPI003AA7B7AC